jgi:hypothetical protein
MAIVSSEANLAEANTTKQAEVIIDKAATRAQSLAMVDALKTHYSASLGTVVAVRQSAIAFNRDGRSYSVASDDASINVEAMPNDLCCKMPNLVWYKPFVGLDNRKVGYTSNATYSGKTVGEPWSRSGENSAFYGNFAF